MAEYLPVHMLVRVAEGDLSKALAAALARLDALGATDTGPFTMESVILQFDAKGDAQAPSVRWLRFHVSDVSGPLLFNHTLGWPLSGALEGVEAAMVAAGMHASRPLGTLTGRAFALDDWAYGVGLLTARGAVTALLLSVALTPVRSRALAPLRLFLDAAEAVLGIGGAANYTFHDTLPNVATALTVGLQYTRAHYCVAWVSVMQFELRQLQLQQREQQQKELLAKQQQQQQRQKEQREQLARQQQAKAPPPLPWQPGRK